MRIHVCRVPLVDRIDTVKRMRARERERDMSREDIRIIKT